MRQQCNGVRPLTAACSRPSPPCCPPRRSKKLLNTLSRRMKAPARCPASPPSNFSTGSRCCPSPPSALPLQLKPSFSSLFPLCSTLPSSKLCARPSSPQAPSSSPSAEPPASPLSSPPSSTATCSLALPAVCGPASSSASSPSTTPLTPTALCVMLPSRAALALPPISSTVLPSACSLPLCPFLPSFLPSLPRRRRTSAQDPGAALRRPLLSRCN